MPAPASQDQLVDCRGPLRRPLLAAEIVLAGRRRQLPLLAQRVGIVVILVAQGWGVNALLHRLLEGVLDALRAAVVVEAGGEAARDAGALLEISQQPGAIIPGGATAVKASDYLAGEVRWKRRAGLGALCGGCGRLAWCNPSPAPTSAHRETEGRGSAFGENAA